MKKIQPLLLLSLVVASFAAQTAELPAPEKDEMTITELEQQLFSLDGKIIETEITYVSNFEQVAVGKYRAYCGYYKGNVNILHGESVLVPEEGKEFFEELAGKDILSSSSKTIYLLVHSEKPIREGRYSYKLEAVGEKYRKSKGEYSW